MTTGRIWWTLPAVVFGMTLLAARPGFGQKVETTYDKSADFGHYKRYAWGKNYLLTRQHPEDQAAIDKALIDSLNRQLQAKGLVLDQRNPDFLIKYEAGGITQAGASAQPDMLNGGAPGPTYASDSLGGNSVDVWSWTLSKMKVTISDASSDKPTWEAMISQKIRDPQKFLNDLNKNVDKVTSKALKTFPPKTERK